MIKVLDHGYVRLVEAWGLGDAGEMEAGIIEAARQSTQGSFRGWDKDQKLLSYLYNSKPKHSSPFEFSGMVLEVQAPIFVFREWHRHRTHSYNEMSARYAALPDLNYVPTIERLMMRSDENKQAGIIAGAPILTEEDAVKFQESLFYMYRELELLYQESLKRGVPKELARLILPVGRYSKMRDHANLRNWFEFLVLRMDVKAQWEIQQYARAVASIIKTTFPQSWKLFAESIGLEEHDV